MFRFFIFIIFVIGLQHSIGIDGNYWDCFKNAKSCLKNLPQNLTEMLRNRHLVMVGDSLTRYQYISLVYALRHGNVVSPLMHPNIVQERDWSGWNDFFLNSNKLLKPFEVCDCFRPDGVTSDRIWFDNRYYYDNINNITVTFLSFVGNPTVQSHGHILPSEVNDTETTRKYPLGYHTEDRWRYETLGALFAEYVPHLPVAPSVIVLNVGRWGIALNEVEVSEIVFNVFASVEFFIWKSTTFAGGENKNGAARADFDRVDSYFKEYDMVTFMNTSWTSNLEESHRWDIMHFREPVYSVLNIQLLDILRAGFSSISEN